MRKLMETIKRLEESDQGLPVGEWLKQTIKKHGTGFNDLNYKDFAEEALQACKMIGVDSSQLKFSLDGSDGDMIGIRGFPPGKAELFNEYWGGGDYDEQSGMVMPTANQIKYFGHEPGEEVMSRGPNEWDGEDGYWSGWWD